MRSYFTQGAVSSRGVIAARTRGIMLEVGLRAASFAMHQQNAIAALARARWELTLKPNQNIGCTRHLTLLPAEYYCSRSASGFRVIEPGEVESVRL